MFSASGSVLSYINDHWKIIILLNMKDMSQQNIRKLTFYLEGNVMLRFTCDNHHIVSLYMYCIQYVSTYACVTIYVTICMCTVYVIIAETYSIKRPIQARLFISPLFDENDRETFFYFSFVAWAILENEYHPPNQFTFATVIPTNILSQNQRQQEM